MNLPILATHAEKLHFVQRFLRGGIPEYPTNRPLMLVGSGGDGKSKIIEEVASTADVNILAIQAGESYRFFPAHQVSETCAILITGTGSQEEMEFGRLMNANVVLFAKDPSYTVRPS